MTKGVLEISLDNVILMLRHLETIVPSLAKIGSMCSSISKEEYHKISSDFLDEWDVTRRLGEIRKILSDLLTYDELEELFENVPVWSTKQTKPPKTFVLDSLPLEEE